MTEEEKGCLERIAKRNLRPWEKSFVKNLQQQLEKDPDYELTQLQRGHLFRMHAERRRYTTR